MKPDSTFESGNNAERDAASGVPAVDGGSVTAMFGTLSYDSDPTEKEFAKPVQSPASAAKGNDLPVVHPVTPQGTQGDSTDALLELLRSAPAPAQAAPPPSTPAAAPIAAPPIAQGGFTQLLRALSPEDLRVPPGPAAAPVQPVTPLPQASATPPAPPVLPSAPPSRGAMTELLRTLGDLPDAGPSSATPPVPPKSNSFRPPAPAPAASQPAPAASGPPAGQGVHASSFTQLVETMQGPAPDAPLSQAVVGGAFENAGPAENYTQSASSPAAKAPASMTQLFQALDTPPPPPKVPVDISTDVGTAARAITSQEIQPGPSQASSFTQMMQAGFGAGPASTPTQTPMPEPAGVAYSETPVRVEAELLPQEQRESEIHARPEPVAPVQPLPEQSAPGAFTQLFQVPSPSAAVGDSAKATEPLAQPAPVPAQAPAPGSFTQILNSADLMRRMSMEGAAQVQPAAAPVPAAAQLPEAGPVLETSKAEPAASIPGPASFTQIFSASQFKAPANAPPVPPVPVEPAAATPSSAAAASAGTFTQLFRTLDSPGPSPAPAAQPWNPTPAIPPVTSDAGSATQTFAAPLVPSPAPSPAPSVAPAASSFTQFFEPSELNRQPPPPSAPTPASAAPSPSSFTQFLQTSGLGQQGAPQAASESFFPPAASPAAGGDLGASQMFSTFPAAADPRSAPSAPARSDFGIDPPPPAPGAAKEQPTQSSSGGLTRLIQVLQQPGAAPASSAPMLPEPSAFPGASTAPATPGTFTSAYGTLGAQPGAPAVPPLSSAAPTFPAVPAPLAPGPSASPVASGPSEFTQILNQSALREALLRGGGAAAGAPAAPVAGGGAPAMPAWTPPAIPQMPQVPTMPAAPAGGGGAPAMPHWQAPAMPQMPATPAIPQPKAPEIKAPETGAPKKLQAYYPLLLILIIFLLIAILIAVIFLVKR